jgi:hypothetical protein
MYKQTVFASIALMQSTLLSHAYLNHEFATPENAHACSRSLHKDNELYDLLALLLSFVKILPSGVAVAHQMAVVLQPKKSAENSSQDVPL